MEQSLPTWFDPSHQCTRPCSSAWEEKGRKSPYFTDYICLRFFPFKLISSPIIKQTSAVGPVRVWEEEGKVHGSPSPFFHPLCFNSKLFFSKMIAPVIEFSQPSSSDKKCILQGSLTSFRTI